MTEPAGEAPRPANSGLVHRISRIPTPLIFGFSVAVAALLLWRQGAIGDVRDAIQGADLSTIAAGMALYLAGLALLCVRWDLIVRMVKGLSNLPRSSEAFLTSVVINYAAPIGLAVPSRAALTKRALGLDAKETGSIALWEVGVDVIVLAIGSALWLLFGGWDAKLVPDTSSAERWLGAAILVCLLLGGVAGLTAMRHFKPNLWAKCLAMLRAFITFPAQRPLMALAAFVVTTIYWVVQGAVMWLLLEALDANPGGLFVLGLMSLPVLVGMLSPVPGGAGIREALMLGVARVHDADAAAVLLAALTYRIALFASIPVLYAGVRFWISRQSGLSQTVTASNDL